MDKFKLNKREKSWVLYDVANSAFTLIVTATIPIYFRGLTENAGLSPSLSSSLWASVTAAAVLILAVFSPILGAMADYQNMKKKLFGFFLCLSLLGVFAFSLTRNWLLFLSLFLIARLGFAACNIFYDSMLIDVTTDERMDMISTYGYAWGYIGSCIPFTIGILLILTTPFGLSPMTATQVSFLITIIWWLVLSIPLFKNVKQSYFLEPRKDFISHSFHRLLHTFQKLKREKGLLFYVIGYFFYIDGVYTIISMATTYGGEVGIDDTAMILALLLTQFIAFPCSIYSGKLAEKFGTFKMIKLFIVMYIVICLFGFQLSKEWEFWALAVFVGICQGGIQALSRSQFGKMIPKEESSEYFGFFDIFGKFADFFGPLIVAVCAYFLNSSRYGILALIFLFLIGILFLSKSEKMMEEHK
ncbi:MFS transporter [bacterium 1XD42-8]|jgi:UMF1 family MFS transporter|nr:MFS transporter [Lachnospiraceae bacterium]RKJ53286.1 MFS transporter [bacterium 1XD42-8]